MKNRMNFFLMAMAVLTLSVTALGVFAQDKETNVWKAPKEADKLVNPFKGDDAMTKAGKKLYKQQCAICHGDTGKGDGVAGMSLKPKPANFRLKRIQEETDGAVFWKITNGNAPMASYKDLLTEEQRWQLVNYIRTLSK